MGHPLVVAVGLAATIGYLLGSIPVAVLVARARGVDPRRVGDRNPGYWNVKEQLGRRAAAPVFAGDLAKGAAAALAAVGVGVALDLGRHDRMVLAWAGAAAAMIGHAWPVFAGFRGGRSILTYVGGLLVWAPRPALACVALLLVVWAATRSFAWASRAGMAATPLVVLALDGVWRCAADGVLLTLIGLRFALAALARPPADPTDPRPTSTDRSAGPRRLEGGAGRS